MLLAALVLTLLNAAEPLVVDDGAYMTYARQILSHPLDPYGFEINWRQGPEPAFGVLAPPVLPYWLAGAMAICGDRPFLLKLSLLPFALALCVSLRRLFARFCPGLEVPLLWMTVLSPSLLPSFNLMLDIPSLGLALSGLVLFMSACERERADLVVVAGLLLGIAMQTKYNAAIPLAALVAHGLTHAKARQSLLAAAVAVLVFAGWEGLLFLRYGESHFVHCALRLGLEHRCAASSWCAGLWGLSLISLVGAVAPAVALLGLVGLRAPTRWIVAALALTTLVFAAIPLFPRETVQEFDPLPSLRGARPEQILFPVLGLAVAGVAAGVFRRLDLARPADRFLLIWLALELVGLLAISPFLATRRVIGLVIVLTLICGRLAAVVVAEGRGRSALRWIAAWGIALGLLFFTSDLLDAVARRNAVSLVESQLRSLGADRERETVWFVGHWGFQYYAERAGMKGVDAGRSRLEAGDWILLPEGVHCQLLETSGISLSAERVVSASPWAWSTIPSFYAGPLPIRRQADAQLVVWIHRVVAPSIPR